MPEEAQAQSFVERKAQQLAQERASGDNEPVAPADPQEDTRPAMESAEVVEDDQPEQGLYADESEQEDDQEYEDADLAETPADDDQVDLEAHTDWEKRYKDLQSETQQIREAEGGRDQEHAQSMADHMQARFQLEDQLTEATRRAEFMLQTMTGNASQYRNINWAQVPPDQVQQVQQQAQQAFQMEQQAAAAYEQFQGYQTEQTDLAKQREAAIAKTRLQRTIPGWGNEVYNKIRDFAGSRGLPPAQFNEITNPVIIEGLNALQVMSEGSSQVNKVKTTRKAKPPRGKAVRRQPRDDRGKFQRAQVEPNTRGSFTEKHRHRLAMERKGR